jgi:general secretion pathway protein G
MSVLVITQFGRRARAGIHNAPSLFREYVWTGPNAMRTAFTFVEIVVVVLVMGILAGVAAPKMLQMSDTATDKGVQQSLSIVRDAIELFQAANDAALPGADGNAATFKSDLAPYVRKFPVLPIAPARNDLVLMTNGGSANGAASPTEGWKYYYDTGRFIVNSHDKTASDDSVRYDEL